MITDSLFNTGDCRNANSALKTPCKTAETQMPIIAVVITLAGAADAHAYAILRRKSPSLCLLFCRGFHTLNVKITIVWYEMISFLICFNSPIAFAFIFQLF